MQKSSLSFKLFASFKNFRYYSKIISFKNPRLCISLWTHYYSKVICFLQKSSLSFQNHHTHSSFKTLLCYILYCHFSLSFKILMLNPFKIHVISCRISLSFKYSYSTYISYSIMSPYHSRYSCSVSFRILLYIR